MRSPLPFSRVSQSGWIVYYGRFNLYAILSGGTKRGNSADSFPNPVYFLHEYSRHRKANQLPEEMVTNSSIEQSNGKQGGGAEETERAQERAREDSEFQPVIIKRSDEALRHPDDTIELAIEEGLEQLNRPFISLILSSIAAGLILGFTAMAVAVVTHILAPTPLNVLTRLATAIVYPLGFVICIVGGTQLFTEHTATSVYPVLDSRASIFKLLRLWVTVLGGNIAGAILSGLLLRSTDEVIQARNGYLDIGEHLVKYTASSLILSAVLAGWLMAQGAWLILAARSTSSQILCIYIVTFLIGLGGLHHSIAGSVEILTAYFISDTFSLAQVLRFIAWAVLGNLIGGTIFVALLNYGHIKQTQFK